MDNYRDSRRPRSSARQAPVRAAVLKPYSTFTPKKKVKKTKKLDFTNDVLIASIIGMLFFVAVGVYGLYQAGVLDFVIRLIG